MYSVLVDINVLLNEKPLLPLSNSSTIVQRKHFQAVLCCIASHTVAKKFVVLFPIWPDPTAYVLNSIYDKCNLQCEFDKMNKLSKSHFVK